jgi:hypothetical protein
VQRSKHLLLAALFFSSVVQGFAQGDYLGGRVAGVITSRPLGGGLLNPDLDEWKPAVTAGISYQHRYSKGFMVGGELWFDRRGYRTSAYGSNQQPSYYYFDYLSMPVIAGFRSRGNGYFIVNMGFVPSVMLRRYRNNTDKILTHVPSSRNIAIGVLFELGGGFQASEKVQLDLTAGMLNAAVSNAGPGIDNVLLLSINMRYRLGMLPGGEAD